MVQIIDFCPHCGNRAVQKEYGRFQHPTDDEGWSSWSCYFLMRCTTCSQPLLYETEHPHSLENEESPHDAIIGTTLLYPNVGQLHFCVPENVKNRYREAAKIRDLSPNGFANQIRRSLEAVCKDRGINPFPLQKALETLASRGEIPDRLSEMTGFIRMLGNIGSHDGDEDVLPEFVLPIDQFFRAVVEYVYVARHNLDEFRNKLDAANAKRKSTST